MRVVIMHNPTAGDALHDSGELAARVRRAGHDVARVVHEERDLAAALGHGCDLVAVVGGDGTVGKAARAVSGTAVPLAIIPAGTANNLGRTLGLVGSEDVDALIAGWARARPRGFDAADVRWSGGSVRIVEAFGVGAFPLAMAEAERREELASERDAVATLDRDRRILRASVAGAPARPHRVTVDGRDCSGRYLLVEAMLIPYVGPNLPLAPEIDPHDGLIDVVMIGEDERDHLIAQLDAILAEEPVRWAPTAVRGRHVTIALDGEASHVDGDLGESAHGVNRRGEIAITATRDAFRMLVPDPGP